MSYTYYINSFKTANRIIDAIVEYCNENKNIQYDAAGYTVGDDPVRDDFLLEHIVDNVRSITEKVKTFRRDLKSILKIGGKKIIGPAEIDIIHEAWNYQYMISDSDHVGMRIRFVWTISEYKQLAMDIYISVDKEDNTPITMAVGDFKVARSEAYEINRNFYKNVKMDKDGLHIMDILKYMSSI